MLTFPWVSSSQTYNSLFDSIYTQVPGESLEVALDSVLAKTATVSGSDTAAMMAGDFYMKFYNASNYSAALKYAKEAIKHLEAAQNGGQAYAKTLHRLGVLLHKNEQSDKAIAAFQQVISLDAGLDRTVKAYCQIGKVYYDLGDYHQSATLYEQGLYLLEQQKVDKYYQGQALNLCGVYTRIEDPAFRKPHLALLRKLEHSDKSLPLSDARYHKLQNNFAN